MRKLLLIFSLWPCWCQGQFSDDFSGDLASWKQDSSWFIIQNGELRSAGPAETRSISISRPSQLFENTSWEFFLRMEFSPSASNYCRIYLAADSIIPEAASNAWYVQAGGESGNTDGIDLYRKNGSTHTKIIDGLPGHAGKETNSLRIRVIRSGSGRWELYSDTLGGRDFLPEGEAEDTFTVSSGYFGIVCTYTSTRSDKFFFDDIRIEPLPVALSHVQVLDETHIRVYLTGSCDPLSLEKRNFRLSPENEITAIVPDPDFSSATLTLSSALENGDHILSVAGIKDPQGNMIPDSGLLFSHYRYGSVLISEIMADPSPSAGLPESEYVELYNPLPEPVRLEGFTLSDPASSGAIPPCELQPGEYLLLCPAGSKQLYPLANTVELSPFPSLNNSGDSITLSSPSGSIVFSVDYTDAWYLDSEKKAGGFSLELADVSGHCKGKEAWRASEAAAGGTPGLENAAFIDPDISPPLVSQVEAAWGNDILLVRTNEEVSGHSLGSFSVPGAEITNTGRSSDSVIIHLKTPLEVNKTYVLEYSGLADCIGNQSPQGSAFPFITAARADSLQVLLSEVLFNPYPYGVDFIELYNPTGNYFNLKGWGFSDHSDSLLFPIPEQVIIPPMGYLAFTTDPANILTNYPMARDENIILLPELPKLPDDEGSVTLKDPDGKAMQHFVYHKSYHHPLLEKQDGVSLERISFSLPENDPHNWHSASGTSGYATPGDENSQEGGPAQGDELLAEPEVISPDGDGWNDFTLINYDLGKEGFTGNMSVYDSEGRLIRKICNNELFGSRGFVKWDGTDESQLQVSTGYYLILLEIFNMKGEKLKLKTSVAVSLTD